MNKSDSQRIDSLLNSLGLTSTDKPQQANLIIINTCSVRQSAEDRVFGFIHNWQELRKKQPKLIIAVTGCMPGRDKDGRIKERIKGVDLFFGIQDLIMLPKWLRELNPDLLTERTDGEILSDYLQIIPRTNNNFQAFVTIQTGCNNYCTYCVVPYARGLQRNRLIKDILAEISHLVKIGVKDIMLLGQVVNNYQAPDKENFSFDNPFKNQDDFSALLWELNQIKGLERINFTASDPQYFFDAQIEALKLPKQINYLHLPAQSGDNKILKKMNRKYSREQYLELVKKIRQARPEIALGTDLIVGFCGETDRQFANTLDLYRQCDFDIAYPAMYSHRSGTAAAKAWPDDISIRTKKERWWQIQRLMEETTLIKNQKYARKKISVLVESCKEGVCLGQSREMKLTQFLGAKELIGQIVPIKVDKADRWILRGHIEK